MSCRDFEHLLIPYANGAQIPEEARLHFASCERCRNLAAAFGAPDSGFPPSAEQLDAIKSKILTDLQPVRPLVPAGVLICALLLVIVVVSSAGAIELGTAGWRGMTEVQKTAVFTSLAGVFGLLAFLLSRQIVPGARVFVSARTAIIASLGIIAGMFVALFHPHAESTFIATGLVCLRIGLEGAIPAAALSWLILRRGTILHPVAIGALTGAFAGLGGLAVLEIFCPNPNLYHMLLWHLGSSIASVIAGTLTGLLSENFWRE